MFCKYFVAKLNREKTWLLTGLLRNEGSIAFERALYGKGNVFEFFVPAAQEQRFLRFVKAVEPMGLFVEKPIEQPNRLAAQQLKSFL